MTNLTWVRHNGQAEMREIARTAIKEAGMTQAATAKAAGIKYNSLVGFLGDRNWLSRADATALAAALALSLDELAGGSIFKDQPDRFDEFDHLSPEWQAEAEEREAAWQTLEDNRLAELAAGRTRALCCECGSMRTCKANRYRWDPVSDNYRARDGHRVIEDLRCFDCKRVTKHAVILTTSEANAAEELDQRPSLYATAVRERDTFIEHLRQFNVAVTYRPGYFSKKKQDFFSTGYEYNSNTLQWEISLDENLPPQIQLSLLKHQWECIAQDRHGVDWDPRIGVWRRPTEALWESATEELMQDIKRFSHAARHQLVLDLQDSVAERDSSTDAR